MKQRKMKVAVSALAAVGCLSTSAMAIEHEFNGLLRVKGIFTNFDQAGGNDASKTNNLSAGNLAKSFFYTEQRARLKYTGTLANDVKLVTHFEIDSRWGDTSQSTTVSSSGNATARNVGGAMEADQVNLETKNVFMQFKVPYLPTTVRAGIQPVDDMYKGIFLGTDAAAVSTVTKLDKATIYATWMRGYDNKNFKGATETVPAVNATSNGAGGTGNMPGRYSLDSFLFDAKFDINKKLKVGGSYYMVYENLVAGNGYNVLNTLGANAAYNFGPGSVDAFFLYQIGDNPVNNYGQTGQKVSAFAANVGGKIKAGPGTARANFLYVSGDDGQGKVSAFQGLNQLGDGNATSTFSAAQMTMLITNTKYAANTDRALVNTVTNYNMGVKGAFLGYDVDINKAFIKGNLGMAAVSQENKTYKPTNKKTLGYNSNYIGTEINAEVGYRISENLTASWVGGYVFLGDYYKDTVTVNGVTKTPDNPWKNMVVLNLSF
jgi:hypothetical protein